MQEQSELIEDLKNKLRDSEKAREVADKARESDAKKNKTIMKAQQKEIGDLQKQVEALHI